MVYLPMISIVFYSKFYQIETPWWRGQTTFKRENILAMHYLGHFYTEKKWAASNSKKVQLWNALVTTY